MSLLPPGVHTKFLQGAALSCLMKMYIFPVSGQNPVKVWEASSKHGSALESSVNNEYASGRGQALCRRGQKAQAARQGQGSTEQDNVGPGDRCV